MRIIINTKDKFSLDELKIYLKFCQRFPVDICVPNDMVKDVAGVYSQNYNNVSELKKSNAVGALIGHSSYFESSKEINKKIKVLSDNYLESIICIGEETISENSKESLQEQLLEILDEITNLDLISIVYEPVWAIGGNKDIDINYILKNAECIKEILKEKKNYVREIYYGGSVDLNLIKELNKTNTFGGYLISSYALNVENISKIYSK